MKRLVPALTLALLLLACKREPAPVAAPPPPAATDTTQAAPLPDGRWQVQPLLVDMGGDNQEPPNAALTATLTEAVLEDVRAMPQVLSVDATATTYLGSNQAGLAVRVAWQFVDMQGKKRDLEHEPVDGELWLTVGVHAEQAVLHGRGEVAEQVFRATLPVPAQRHEPLDVFLKTRVASALQRTVARVLGELWARQLPDASVTDLLEEDEDWRKAVGAREAGERKLADARAALEKLAHSSKRELAVVAVAALGRLGDVKSVPVPVACADSGHLDVVDAALQALADMTAPEARAALTTIAAEHGEPGIRQRAADLLKARPGHK